MVDLTDALISELTSMDTPTVCNALELLSPRRRGYGYTTRQLLCARPEMGPIVGIARTATIRSVHPSDLSSEDGRRMSDTYYAYIDGGAKPSVVVIQDIDDQRVFVLFGGVKVNEGVNDQNFGLRPLNFRDYFFNVFLPAEVVLKPRP